jgi:hypothetical protein
MFRMKHVGMRVCRATSDSIAVCIGSLKRNTIMFDFRAVTVLILFVLHKINVNVLYFLKIWLVYSIMNLHKYGISSEQ